MEDNPADARLVQMALEEHGVVGELMILVDGEKAVKLIESIDAGTIECPDLMIIDLNLPRIPGRMVLERMRRSAVCCYVPVVILSSSNAAQDKADAARFGANHYLRKPSHLDDFIALGVFFKEALRQYNA